MKIESDGAVPRAIKAMNEKVKIVLETAAKEVGSSDQICMIGKLKNKKLEVVSVREIKTSEK